MKCNLCGGTTFTAQGSRRGVRCTSCHSLERSRLLWMYIEKLRVTPNARVLHFAPERGIWTHLSKIVAPENYHVADIDPARYTFAKGVRRIDLTDLDGLPSDHYDLILHSHVMEHVPCNIAYTLYHLHRALRPAGTHLCIIPFLPGHYDECFAEIGDSERIRRFGQNDHVRRFGTADIDRSLGSVLRFDREYDVTRDFPPQRLQEANIPPYTWRGLTVHTVLHLRKSDMRLLHI